MNNLGIEIVQMQENTVDEVVRIENTSFKTPWPRQIFLSEIKKAGAYCRIAKDSKGKTAGYCISNIIYDELHILKVAVDEQFRRKGIGRLLIEDSIVFHRPGGANSVMLEVRVSNKSAISLYNRMGFNPVRVRKNYYQTTGEDALVMAMELESYYQKVLSTT